MTDLNAFQYDGHWKAPGVYQEMWFFDVHDRSVAFFLNLNVNVIKVAGIKIKIADIVAQVTVKGRVFYNEGDDGFFRKFRCSKEKLSFRLGNDDIVIEADGNDAINVKGYEKKSDFFFDFRMARIFDPWKPVVINIGNGANDNITYYSHVPLGRVKGMISVDGEKIDIDGFGYHDHDWGFLSSVQWTPWLIAVGENVVCSVVSTPMDSMVHFQNEACEFSGAIDSMIFDGIIKGTREDCKTIIKYPTRITIVSKNNGQELKMKTIMSDDRMVVNMGFCNKECLAVHDTNALSEICIGGKLYYLQTTCYYWNLLNF